MNKKILCFILIFLCSILPVKASYKTAYTTQKTYVYKKASTNSKRVSLKKNTKIYIIKTKGKFYQVYNSKKTTKGYILKKYVKEKTDNNKISTSWKSKIKKTSWSKTKNILKNDQYAFLYLIETKERIFIKRLGGLNHADLEPANINETEKLKRLCKGTYSWNTHPVILEVNEHYIAASINTMPHGRQTIKDNDYNGHFCLHTVGSKTHGTNKVQKEHQKTINEAYKWRNK